MSGFQKKSEKLKSYDGFLRIVNSAHWAANFFPAQVCPQKAIVGIIFLTHFCNLSHHQVGIKKCCKKKPGDGE